MSGERVDYRRAFERIPSITGLPVVRSRCGRHWYAKAYLDGRKSKRWDKTVISLMRDGGIAVLEQGGESMSLWTWLLRYGGCNDNMEVLMRLREETVGDFEFTAPLIVPDKPMIHVPYSYITDSLEHELGPGSWLTMQLGAIFGPSKTKIISRKYCLGASDKSTVFWYINQNYDVCHDKIVEYAPGLKRNRHIHPGRKFKKRDGYTDTCYFGEHLIAGCPDEPVYLVESEKTAIIMALRYNKLCLATGGSSCLRNIGDDWILLPDYDEAGFKWFNKYPDNCVKWWEHYSDVQYGEDIADVIIRELQTNHK